MRKTCTAGEITAFKFDSSAEEYRVKNFSEGDILVTHKNEFIESEASKIKSMHGEDFSVNELEYQAKRLTVKVKVEKEGEVEVSLTKF